MADNFEKIIFQIQADTANAQAGLKTLNDQLKGTAKGVDEVKKSSMSLGDVFKQIAPTMAAVFSANILQSSIGNMKSFFDEGVKKAIEMERATQRLKAAYDGNAAGAERMLAFASKLSATTLFSKGDILAAESLAAQLGRTESQTKKMITAAMGLSNVTGVDLQTAMMQLSGTFEGVMGRLGRYDNRLKGLTDEQKRNGVAVDILAEKLGKFATQGVDTAAGAMIMLEKSWNGFKRATGELFLPAIASVTKGLSTYFNAWRQVFSSPKNINETIDATKTYKEELDELTSVSGKYTESVEKEQLKLNELYVAATSNIEGTQERKTAIDALKTAYPQYLSYLNSDTASNETLSIAVAKVNQQLRLKLALAQQADIVSALQKETGKQELEAFNNLIKLQEAGQKWVNSGMGGQITQLNKGLKAFKDGDFATAYKELIQAFATMGGAGINIGDIASTVDANIKGADKASEALRRLQAEQAKMLKLQEASKMTINDIVITEKKAEVQSEKTAEKQKKIDEDRISRLKQINEMIAANNNYMLTIQEKLDEARILNLSEEKERELQLEELALQKRLSIITGSTEQENALRQELQEMSLKKRVEINEKYNQIEVDDNAVKVEEIADKQKITFDDVVSSITQLAQESAKILSLFIEDYDKQIEKQQDNLSKAYDLAEKGNTTVVENEKKRMQELTRERKKYVNAQRALLMIETIANAVSAIAKSANLPPPLNIVAVAATLASLTAGIMKAKQIGEAGQTGFRKGGYTGHKGVDDVAGVVHGQEYVMTASATKGNLQYFDAINTGKLSIAQLVKESAMYRALIPRERFTATSTTKPDATLSKLDSIEKSIKGQNRLTLKIDKNGISGIVSQYQSRQNRINKITRLG